MASLQSISLVSPRFRSKSPHFSSSNVTSVAKFPLNSRRKSLPILFCTSSEQFLQFVAESSDERTLPCVRTYENDLARLSIVGSVSSDQAITAAAADGGRTTDENLESGILAMVAETVFPGSADESATISTRLFLSARKVKEKARKLRKSFTKDIMESTSSTDILAMTFKQVVLQQLWNFELLLFKPGTERNMKDLKSPREALTSFSISSSDERTISVLSQAVCSFALQSTERNFTDNRSPTNSFSFIPWFRKSRRSVSKDSSVIIYPLFRDDIAENAKNLLEKFNMPEEKLKPVRKKAKSTWWTSSSAKSKLENIGGDEFAGWTDEYVPAYCIQIDVSKLENLKFEGWHESAKNKWTVLLTHSQMVALAGILDMFYEDLYSLPNKQLSHGVVGNITNVPIKKRSISLINILSITLVSGIFLVAVSALGNICLPYLRKQQISPGECRSLSSSEAKNEVHQVTDATKLEEICISVVETIKQNFSWSDDVTWQLNVGAWIGKVPQHLKVIDEVYTNGEENSSDVAFKEKLDLEIELLAEDIATYQVVLSTDGKVVGFQPTSRVSVNHWASNPLAKQLYDGRKLSPGFFESSPNVTLPKEIVVIELLVCANPDARFALARPMK